MKDKFLDTYILVLLIIALLAIILLYIDTAKTKKDITELKVLSIKKDQISSLLYQSQVIIKKDTFDIVNIDWRNNTVLLDNGRELNYLYARAKIDKQVIKKIDSINNHK